MHQQTNVDPVFYILGANTGVGKTVLSALVSRTALRQAAQVFYAKPLQTGFPTDDDARFVTQFCQKTENPEQLTTRTFFSWHSPVSAHLAAIHEDKPVTDEMVVDELHSFLARRETPNPTVRRFFFVEGAGGVASPSSSGTLQCDLFRRLRHPVLLVADPFLGGISTTISSWELLRTRGFEVPFVVIFANEQGNAAALEKHFSTKCKVIQLPRLPLIDADIANSEIRSNIFINSLQLWEKNNSQIFLNLMEQLDLYCQTQATFNREMEQESKNIFWWPFTQHNQVKKTTVIDSALQDSYSILDLTGPQPIARPSFDASASWWTQNIGHGNPDLSKACAHSLGRFGHVIFPECTHEPAYKLACSLLTGPGEGWASRVFYSDNGSTAVEVAIKMAFRLAHSRQKHSPNTETIVMGLKDSYHGDTIGAMDASEPNPYNQREIWYRGRGFWIDYPRFYCARGKWLIDVPEVIGGVASKFGLVNRDEAFAEHRNRQSLATSYRAFISQKIEAALKSNRLIGALIIEPVLLGAGGMQAVDPLFQRILVQECRSRGIPVVFDEIFCGFWRLGSWAAHTLIDERPDIACFAKGLTGGTIPLAVTLTTEEVFRAFSGESKLEALLHGHSYTAHPAGCAVALEAMHQIQLSPTYHTASRSIADAWDNDIVEDISTLPGVFRSWHKGLVMACELATGSQGYASNAAADLIDTLRKCNIYARPLGNVLYLMATVQSHPDTLSKQLRLLHRILKSSASENLSR